MPRIIRNAIRCEKCGDIIESKTIHDFKCCSCGACAVVVVTTIFAGAAISEIGKNYPKLKKRRTMALWFDSR